ncbi:RNA-directed DNA polymerase, eukaryota [Tanacetum coccineum]
MYHFQTTHLEVVLSCLVQWYYEVTPRNIISAATHFGGVTEGDENSKYFHGVMNKRRHQMAIRGLCFLNEELFPISLSQSQQEMLEVEVTDEEIKNAVWDCGRNKSSGPDGIFPKGCNPSFIALIPKINDAKFVKGFRPISLIGCQYKIVGKILANRLSLVIGSLISKEQSAFIRGRQILDGPLILSEVIEWCNLKKKKAMIFKVHFEKAYDSVKWEFLDMILNRFGFGEA